MSDVKVVLRSLIPLTFVHHYNTLLSFNWFFTWSTAFIGRYLMTLTSCGLQASLSHLNTMAYLGVHAGIPLTHTRLTSATFLCHRGRFHNTFLVPLTLKSEPCVQSCQVLPLLGLDHGPSFKYIFISFLVFDGLSLAVLEFTL